MEPETDLFRELELAWAECDKLREENARLKQQLMRQEKPPAGIEGCSDTTATNPNPLGHSIGLDSYDRLFPNQDRCQREVLGI